MSHGQARGAGPSGWGVYGGIQRGLLGFLPGGIQQEVFGREGSKEGLRKASADGARAHMCTLRRGSRHCPGRYPGHRQRSSRTHHLDHTTWLQSAGPCCSLAAARAAGLQGVAAMGAG